MALYPGSDRVMNYYSSVVLLSKRVRYALLHSRSRHHRNLLAKLGHLVYLGRTCDPHRRAREWRSHGGNSLGASLRELDAMGYLHGRDYITACRVWFRFKGAKNTPKRCWDLPESAFKLLCARDPFKLHDQRIESLSDDTAFPVTTNVVSARWTEQRLTRVAYRLLRTAVCGT